MSIMASHEPQRQSFHMKTCHEHEAFRNLPQKTRERQSDECQMLFQNYG